MDLQPAGDSLSGAVDQSDGRIRAALTLLGLSLTKDEAPMQTTSVAAGPKRSTVDQMLTVIIIIIIY